MKNLHRPNRPTIIATLAFGFLSLVLAGISQALSPVQQISNADMPASVIFQVRNDNSVAVHNFVIGRDLDKWLSLPSRLVLISQNSTTSISEAAAGLNLENSSKWFSETYDFEISETVVIDRVALAALVDLVEGVEVVPDADLMLELASEPVIYVSENQKVLLSGSAASLYATSSAYRPERFIQVWRAVLEKLDAAYLETVLPSVGNSSRSTMPLALLIKWLETNQAVWAAKSPELIEADVQIQKVDGLYRPILSPAALAQLADLQIPRSNS